MHLEAVCKPSARGSARGMLDYAAPCMIRSLQVSKEATVVAISRPSGDGSSRRNHIGTVPCDPG